jgi:hypothetical protein
LRRSPLIACWTLSAGSRELRSRPKNLDWLWANGAIERLRLTRCVATADTVEDVEHEIRDAIRFHIEGLREDGPPVPRPTSNEDTWRREPHRQGWLQRAAPVDRCGVIKKGHAGTLRFAHPTLAF